MRCASLPSVSVADTSPDSGAGVRARPAFAAVLSGAHSFLVPPLRMFNSCLRALTAFFHHFQYKVEGFLRPSAEWFDHEIDVHWQWVAKQRSMFLERGVLNTLAMRPEAEILELCCGDGFNAHRFYAGRGSRVLAVDYNAQALRHARRYHGRPNVEYRQCDIRGELPQGPFDNIVWDSAIHHFSEPEATAILSSAQALLRPAGVLSGYTIIEPHAEYAYARMRFSSPEELAELLGRVFAHVAVLETPDALRRNLYFFASNTHEALPFTQGVNRLP
jgi:2-polyprenyl-3-methyl-5-hydroxy-6-metoxy-1,4-benzoquinol methylase